jgi:hypothetical protein
MCEYRMWFNGLKYIKTCSSFHMKQNVEIFKQLRQFAIMMCESKKIIII